MPERSNAEIQVIKDAYLGSLDGWYDWYVGLGELHVSKRWLNILGVKEKAGLGKLSLWSDRVHPGDYHDVMKQLSDHLNGNSQSFSSVYRMKRDDGHTIWVYDRGKIIEWDENGLPSRMTGLLSDITTFRNVSLQLQESKRDLEYRIEFEELINRISSGFININVENIDKAVEESLGMIGQFMQVERSYIFLIDYSQATMTNSHEWCAPGVNPEKDNLFEVPLEAMHWWMNILSGNKAVRVPVVSQIPDEDVREVLELQSIKSVLAVPIFNGARIIGFVGFDAVAKVREWSDTDEQMLRTLSTVFLNVLTLKDVQLELAAYRNHLQEIIEEKTRDIQEKAGVIIAKDRELNTLWNAIQNSANGIVITDAEKKFIYYNDAFCAFSGYNNKELIGQTPKVLRSDRHDETYYKQIRETLLSGKTWKGQFINKRKDGRLYTEENVITPIFDENGILINYIAVKQDITRELLIKTESERNEKLRALGTLAGGIAHDFNNILQVIQSYTELIEITSKEGPVNEEFIRQILDGTHKGKKLVESILMFSKQELKPLEIQNIADLTNQTIQTITPLYIQRIKLITNIQDCGSIPLNPIQFQQVLINLIDNAADAVTINREVKVLLERKKVKCETNDSTLEVVELTVSDKGQGMSEEAVARLFEPFFTTKPVGEGTGLGMPMVKGIVDNHGGKIFVDSAPGQGTTIRVHFPAASLKFTSR